MKKLSLFLLFTVLFASSVFSQDVKGVGSTVGFQHKWIQEQVYYKATYTNATLDTTTWIDVEPYNELAMNFVATDSATFDIYVDARNSKYPTILATNFGLAIYADSLTTSIDSIATFVNTGGSAGLRRQIVLKNSTVNRVLAPAYDQIRFRVDHRAAGAGTTAGRTMKIFLIKQY